MDTVYGISSQETSSFCLLENSLLELWNHFQAIWQPCWSNHLERPWEGELSSWAQSSSTSVKAPDMWVKLSWNLQPTQLPADYQQVPSDNSMWNRKNYPAKAGTNFWPIDHEYNKMIAALCPWVWVNLLYSNRYSNYFIPRAPKKTQDSSSPYITVSGRILKLTTASPRFQALIHGTCDYDMTSRIEFSLFFFIY